MNEEAPLLPSDPPPADRRRMIALWLGMEFLGLLLFVGTLYVWFAPDWKAHREAGKAGKADAAAAAALAAAVERYAAAHDGRPPAVPVIPNEGGDTDTDTSPASGLVAALMGRGPDGGADLLQGFPRASSSPDAPHGWRSGLVSGPDGCAVYDSHGRFFQARLDIGGDGLLPAPDGARHDREKKDLPGKAILWSAGKDGNPDTWDDNAVSWE